jgi:putative oxidoreductase
MEKASQLTARILLGHIFLLAGLSKIGAYEGTQAYMDAMGVNGALLPMVILLEVAGGLAIIAGWKTKYTSVALAVFTVVAAVIFHSNFGDQIQMILFMKNIAITGGLMLLAVHGAGAYSVDNRRLVPATHAAVSHS